MARNKSHIDRLVLRRTVRTGQNRASRNVMDLAHPTLRLVRTLYLTERAVWLPSLALKIFIMDRLVMRKTDGFEQNQGSRNVRHHSHRPLRLDGTMECA